MYIIVIRETQVTCHQGNSDQHETPPHTYGMTQIWNMDTYSAKRWQNMEPEVR